jgi:hypothetical protein
VVGSGAEIVAPGGIRNSQGTLGGRGGGVRVLACPGWGGGLHRLRGGDFNLSVSRTHLPGGAHGLGGVGPAAR